MLEGDECYGKIKGREQGKGNQEWRDIVVLVRMFRVGLIKKEHSSKDLKVVLELTMQSTGEGVPGEFPGVSESWHAQGTARRLAWLEWSE